MTPIPPPPLPEYLRRPLAHVTEEEAAEHNRKLKAEYDAKVAEWRENTSASQRRSS